MAFHGAAKRRMPSRICSGAALEKFKAHMAGAFAAFIAVSIMA